MLKGIGFLRLRVNTNSVNNKPLFSKELRSLGNSYILVFRVKFNKLIINELRDA